MGKCLRKIGTVLMAKKRKKEKNTRLLYSPLRTAVFHGSFLLTNDLKQK